MFDQRRTLNRLSHTGHLPDDAGGDTENDGNRNDMATLKAVEHV